MNFCAATLHSIARGIVFLSCASVHSCVRVPNSVNQARREPQRGPGNHYRGGTITTSFRMRRDNMPKLPQRGRLKTDFMHICGQKEAILEHPFQYFRT